MKLTMVLGLLEALTRRVLNVEKKLPDPKALADDVLARIRVPEDGVSPDPEALVEAVLARVPTPQDGVSPDLDMVVERVLARVKVPAPQPPSVAALADAFRLALPEPVAVAPAPAPEPIRLEGEPGPMGPMPNHKWDGTKLSFEKPSGGYGKAVDLRGPPGKGKGGGGVILAQTGGEGGAGIDDSVTAADKTWSSEKIQAELDALAPDGGAVTSVNGRGGAITLSAEDVGLQDFAGLAPETLPMSAETTMAVADLQGQVDALPDTAAFAGLTPATLPVSAATQEEIDDAVTEAKLYADTALAALVDSAPEALNTLNEFAAALGDDPNFAATTAAAIGGKEPSITAGSSTQYWRGDKTWRDLATDIRGAVLTGLSTASAATVAATDSVLVAIGKLQAQASAVRSVALGGTGGTTASEARAGLGMPGRVVVNSAYGEYLGIARFSSLIPLDDTIPQIGEGDAIISFPYTPKSATNILRLRFRTQASVSNLNNITVALFVGAGGNAVRASMVTNPVAGYTQSLTAEVEVPAGTTSAITVQARMGLTSAGSYLLNGLSDTSGRIYGGVSATTLTVEELTP